jgi:hypothetical protein
LEAWFGSREPVQTVNVLSSNPGATKGEGRVVDKPGFKIQVHLEERDNNDKVNRVIP